MPPRPRSRSQLGVDFGVVVRRERIARGWSQDQLADHAQLSRNQVSLIELGKTAATLWAVERLSAALGRSADELLRAALERRGKEL